MNQRLEALRMKGKRQWFGRRVWVANLNGKRRQGTLWFTDETSVVIREDGRTGLLTFPKESEGTRWGFAAEGGGDA